MPVKTYNQMKAVAPAWTDLQCVIYGSLSQVAVPKILAIFFVAFSTFLPSRTGEHIVEMSIEPPAHLHSDWNLIGLLE